jgi:glycosyltransferase involved in cell wall biosynthesis
MMGRRDVAGYLGVEFGALASLTAARHHQKTGIVAFLSAHHATRARWVDPEIARFQVTMTDAERHLQALAAGRDARRDQELALADGVISGSSFTTRSLVAAGVDPYRILTVPLGAPPAVELSELPALAPTVTRVVYAGPVALHKGVHHLLEAWSRLSPAEAELHLYGQVRLPREVIERATMGSAARSVTFHGSVPGFELRDVYRQAGVLVLPTLADGFGQVVADALSQGLPVVTTTNAGAADRIVDGENGFVLPPGDVPQLCATLDWCLTNRDKLFAMKRAAVAQARQWTWAHFRRAFADGVVDMLTQQRPAAVARIA